MPIVAEVAGTVKFEDIIDGVTMNEQLDEVTGLSRKSSSSRATPTPGRASRSRSTSGRSQDHRRHEPAPLLLPARRQHLRQRRRRRRRRRRLAKIPRESAKTKDITGGLPRVAELFEARKPKEHAVITEIDGVVSFGKDTKGKRKVHRHAGDRGQARDDRKEYLIRRGSTSACTPAIACEAGEALMDGAANPHDILKVLGEKELASYLVNEIQEVYRLQGVKINDKHIETIVRQMLRRVRVTDPATRRSSTDEHVEKHVFEEENEQVMEKGGTPATGEPLLLGITKASLSTESFISASSFQETTKVLTEAAISGAVDRLRGLKENVIMGRLIPAGTGLSSTSSSTSRWRRRSTRSRRPRRRWRWRRARRAWPRRSSLSALHQLKLPDGRAGRLGRPFRFAGASMSSIESGPVAAVPVDAALPGEPGREARAALLPAMRRRSASSGSGSRSASGSSSTPTSIWCSACR